MVVNKVIWVPVTKIVYHEYIEKVLSLGKVKEHTAIEDVTYLFLREIKQEFENGSENQRC